MMAREMDFPNQSHIELSEVGVRIERQIRGADEYIVDVEQNAATGAPRHFIEECRFRHFRAKEAYIQRGILNEDHPAQRVLNFVDVGNNGRERFLVIGQRQQVIEENTAGGAPGQMFGYKARLSRSTNLLRRLRCALSRSPALPMERPTPWTEIG